MDYMRLGSSDVEVSRVMLGAWAIGGWKWGGADDEESVAAIREAIDTGMTTIDTAPIYGFGHSERIVGEAIEGRRDQVIIATKCGLRWEGDEGQFFFDHKKPNGGDVRIYRNLKPDSVLKEIDQSLERLGVDYVDLYQCHWPDSTTPIPQTMEALNRIREEGKARAVGLSNFTPEMIAECLEHGPIASDQPLYNMLDRQAEDELLPYCADNGVGVVTYSSMHQGLLTGKVTMDREFEGDDIRKEKPWFGSENRRRVLEFLEKVQPIADAHHKTLAQVAINWTLCQRGVTAAIVGARRPEQVRENAGGAGWSLTHEDLARIRGWLEELGDPA
jgi:methylglyoxal reductase